MVWARPSHRLLSRQYAALVDLNYSGCSSDQQSQISSAWNDAAEIAGAIREMSLDSDPAALDFFGPAFQTTAAGSGDLAGRILSVYDSISAFTESGVSDSRVNVFCQSEDAGLWNRCPKGVIAYEWDTPCSDGRCEIDETDPTSAYVNIVFCDYFFEQETLAAAIERALQLPESEKYNLDTYWETQGSFRAVS